MLVDALRFVLVAALVVLVPGFLLVQAAFPPRRAALTASERAYLAIAGGVLLVALVGVSLGLLPGPGLFSTMATGFPHVELALLGSCGVLLWIGLHRGAYPRLAAWIRARQRAPAAGGQERGSLRP